MIRWKAKNYGWKTVAAFVAGPPPKITVNVVKMSSPEAVVSRRCDRKYGEGLCKASACKGPCRGQPRSCGTSAFVCFGESFLSSWAEGISLWDISVVEPDPREGAQRDLRKASQNLKSTNAVNLGKSRVALPYLNGINGANKSVIFKERPAEWWPASLSVFLSPSRKRKTASKEANNPERGI